LIESSVASYNKSFPVTFVKAVDSFLYDENGKKYIDFFTGAGTMNYGHNNKKINDAIIDYIQNNGILHSLDMDTRAKLRFLESLENIILKPRNLDFKVQFCAPSGANSVEAALKLSRKIKRRRKVIAFSGSFHGMSLGALSVTANKYYKSPFFPTSDVQFIPYENYIDGLDSLKFLRKVLVDNVSGVEIPAAIILETIQADGGINVASNEFLKGIRDICNEFDILMIVDDVQVGNGRSGDFFSFERANIVPDMITLSKGIGAGFPLSILLFKSEFDVWKRGEHTGTFRGNNLSFIAGSIAIEEYWSIENFSKEIKKKSKIMEDFLKDFQTVRGYGMIWGIELDSKKALLVRENCFKKGLILELVGANDNVVKLLPPLTINESDLKEGLEILKEAISESA
jgi:diaminobutyrate-2-oxoglutarate transaminase